MASKSTVYLRLARCSESCKVLYVASLHMSTHTCHTTEHFLRMLSVQCRFTQTRTPVS